NSNKNKTRLRLFLGDWLKAKLNSIQRQTRSRSNSAKPSLRSSSEASPLNKAQAKTPKHSKYVLRSATRTSSPIDLRAETSTTRTEPAISNTAASTHLISRRPGLCRCPMFKSNLSGYCESRSGVVSTRVGGESQQKASALRNSSAGQIRVVPSSKRLTTKKILSHTDKICRDKPQVLLPTAVYRQLTTVELDINEDNFIRMWKTLLLKRAQDVHERAKHVRPANHIRLSSQIICPAPLADLAYSFESQPSDTSYRVPIILLCSALARSQLGTVRHEHLEGIARESLSGAVTLLSLRLGGVLWRYKISNFSFYTISQI
ncbi:hypothetical protein WDU94_015608, partial [Cyamophila willieti]